MVQLAATFFPLVLFWAQPAPLPLRTMRYMTRQPEAAVAWQRQVRTKLFRLLKLDDLVARPTKIPLAPRKLSSEQQKGYELTEVVINLPSLLAFFDEQLHLKGD